MSSAYTRASLCAPTYRYIHTDICTRAHAYRGIRRRTHVRTYIQAYTGIHTHVDIHSCVRTLTCGRKILFFVGRENRNVTEVDRSAGASGRRAPLFLATSLCRLTSAHGQESVSLPFSRKLSSSSLALQTVFLFPETPTETCHHSMCIYLCFSLPLFLSSREDTRTPHKRVYTTRGVPVSSRLCERLNALGAGSSPVFRDPLPTSLTLPQMISRRVSGSSARTNHAGASELYASGYAKGFRTLTDGTRAMLQSVFLYSSLSYPLLLSLSVSKTVSF